MSTRKTENLAVLAEYEAVSAKENEIYGLHFRGECIDVSFIGNHIEKFKCSPKLRTVLIRAGYMDHLLAAGNMDFPSDKFDKCYKVNNELHDCHYFAKRLDEYDCSSNHELMAKMLQCGYHKELLAAGLIRPRLFMLPNGQRGTIHDIAIRYLSEYDFSNDKAVITALLEAGYKTALVKEGYLPANITERPISHSKPANRLKENLVLAISPVRVRNKPMRRSISFKKSINSRTSMLKPTARRKRDKNDIFERKRRGLPKDRPTCSTKKLKRFTSDVF